MRQRLGALALACLMPSPAGAQTEPSPVAPPTSRGPRVALVLSGGGARGIAHIGALRALEEAGVPVDAIAATSVGAVVGGIYSTGRSSAELEHVVRSLDWASLFSGRSDRRTLPVARRDDRYGDWLSVSFDARHVRLSAGLLAEHRVNRFLIGQLSPAGYAASGDFDRLPIPLRVVATDLANGERVVLSHGDLARAVRASMSIPVAFPPVEWEGRTLVDGGLVDNVPSDVAKAFGAAVTVAVDVSSPELAPEEYESSIGIATQVTDVLSRRRNRDFRVEADVAIRPDLHGHSNTDYSDFDALIRAGYDATRAAAPQILEKLRAAGVEDRAPRPHPIPDRSLEGSEIVEVVARGNANVSERLLLRTFNIPLGPTYVMEKGLRAFDKVDATGLLERSWLEFEPAPGGVRVVLRAQDAAPNRAGVGLGYSEWEKARISVRLRNQNTLGFGEQVELLLAASDAETLAQMSLRGDRLFVTGLGYRASAYAFTDKPRFFSEDGAEINRGKFERQGVSLALQAPVKRFGMVEGGALFGRVKTIAQAGVPLADANDTVGELVAGFTLDTLDDLLWPRAGGRLAARAEWNLESLGATRPYWRLRLEGRAGHALGRASVQVDGLAGLSGDGLPVYDHFRLGGPILLPGYAFEELKGSQALAGAVSVRCRAVGSLHLVARAGAGNVFGTRDEIDLSNLRWGAGFGLYYPSRVGPVSIELGFRDGGSSLLSLTAGWN